jgi:hypothetical protein
VEEQGVGAGEQAAGAQQAGQAGAVGVEQRDSDRGRARDRQLPRQGRAGLGNSGCISTAIPQRLGALRATPAALSARRGPWRGP